MSETPPIRAELEALQGYLDGELSPGEAREVEARLAAEPDLRRQIEGVGAEFALISSLVGGELDAAAADVHEARFEQIWDAVERELDGAAVEAAGPAPASWWHRAGEFVRNARLPLGLAGAGAVAALVVFVVANPDPGAPGAQVAQESAAPTEPAAEPDADPEAAESEAPTRLADAVVAPAPEPLPAPESNEADVERIEFGGASGRISKIEGVRGTTTVIWIEEDEEPVDSEQSL